MMSLLFRTSSKRFFLKEELRMVSGIWDRRVRHYSRATSLRLLTEDMKLVSRICYAQTRCYGRETKPVADKSIAKLTERFPDLKTFKEDRLRPYLTFMCEIGFSLEQASEMVLIHPALLVKYKESIPDGIQTWRSLGCSTEDATHILSQHPQLTTVSPFIIGSKFNFLKQYFSKAESLYAIESTFSIITETEKVLEKKLHYLIKELSHRPYLVAASKALSYPLNHMKMRHEFLIRSGLFIPVPHSIIHKMSYTIHTKLKRPNYSPPADVICTEDEEFITKCCAELLTLNELAAFELAFEKEMLEKVEEDDEEDSEDEKDKDEIIDDDLEVRNSSAFFNPKDTAEFYY